MDINTPRQVGKSSLTLKPLGFGAAPIGHLMVSNEDSLATVAAAWQSGVRFYDTAPWYGHWPFRTPFRGCSCRVGRLGSLSDQHQGRENAGP